MKRWMLLTGAAILVALAAVTWAVPPERGPRAGRPGDGGPGPGGAAAWLCRPEAARQAGLSEEQATKIADLAYQTRKEQIRLRSELELAQLELQRALASESADEAKALAAVEAVGQKEIELKKVWVRHEIQMRGIVGAEKMRELRQDRRDDKAERWGDGPRRRGPQGERPERPGPRRGPEEME